MFTLPENFADLTLDELKALRVEAIAAAKEIDAKGETLPKEDVEALNSIMDAIGEIDAAVEEIGADEAAATDARSRLAALDADETPDAGGDGEEGDEEGGEGEEESEAEAKTLEPVLAAGRKRSTAARASSKAPKPEPTPEKAEAKFGGLTIVAAANVPDFVPNQNLEGMEDVAKAFLGRSTAFGGDNSWQGRPDSKPQMYKVGKSAQQFGVAKMKRAEKEGLVLDPRSQTAEQQFEIIMDAAKESRLPNGSLTAAGGWCAPSEQIWGFCELETTEGLLDIAEITARRGGISFTKGPDFGDLFADPNFGFIQTETQAEAGTAKPCYPIECEPWEEVRLDAVGFCITAPILTNAAYPELVRRVLNLAGVGQARRINASTIQRISALIGAATVFTPVAVDGGQSGVADTLEATALQALRIRQTNAMSPKATIEGIAPHWLREYFRSDLSRRMGVDMLAVTDAQIDGFFSVRGIRLQYVYDYQMLTAEAIGTGAGTAGWTALPDTAEIMMYPAGAYVRLTADVINLNAVYDHDLLTQNTYTAAFFEEGMAVANTCGGGVKVQIGLNNHGAVGYPAIGALANVAPTAP